MSIQERWLLPERPGMRQFVIVLGALLLPIACLMSSEAISVPALVISITIGCGLGIAWTALTGWQWLKRAPVNSLCVFVTAFGSLANLELMPRWEVAVRARNTLGYLQHYAQTRSEGRTIELSDYDTGPVKARFRQVDREDGKLLAVYTASPLQRWTPFGFRPGCYVLVRGDGTWQVVKTEKELEAVLEQAKAKR